MIAALVLAVFLMGTSPQYCQANEVSSTITILNGQIVKEAAAGPKDDLKNIIPSDSRFNSYIDYPRGYRLNYPKHLQVDVSLSRLRTVMADENTRIEVYYDDFSRSDSVTSAAAYINYGNRFIYNGPNILQEDRYLEVNGLKTHLLRWTREKLPRVPGGDMNYYVSAEIIKNQQEVYTILIKSSRPIDFYLPVINSFTLIEKQGKAAINHRYNPVEKAWNQETVEFYEDYFAADKPLTWGIFEPYAPVDLSSLTRLEKKLEYTFPIVVYYQTLDSPAPVKALQNAYEADKYVELTLQTFSYNLDAAGNQNMTYKILNGEYDSYFHQYARSLKNFGHPVLFRLNNEMNGDWCTYSSYYSSKDTQLYKAVWQYIYGIFQEHEVDNVIWVWNPHDISFPDFGWNDAFMYYPGDEYVDIVGLTGYNTGTYYPGEKWRSFIQVYDPIYHPYSAQFGHPLMITEFGCSSVGGDKVEWINRMFAQMKLFPRIKVAIWWSGTDWDSNMNPARIYRLDETPATLEAFRQNL